MKRISKNLLVPALIVLALLILPSVFAANEYYKARCADLGGSWGSQNACNNICGRSNSACENLINDPENPSQPYLDEYSLMCYKCGEASTLGSLSATDEWAASCAMQSGKEGTQEQCRQECEITQKKQCVYQVTEGNGAPKAKPGTTNTYCYQCGASLSTSASAITTPGLTSVDEWSASCAMLGGQAGSRTLCDTKCRSENKICNIEMATTKPGTQDICFTCKGQVIVPPPSTTPQITTPQTTPQTNIPPSTASQTTPATTPPSTTPSATAPQTGQASSPQPTAQAPPGIPGAPGFRPANPPQPRADPTNSQGQDERTNIDSTPGQPVEKSSPATPTGEDWILDCPSRPPRAYAYVWNYLHADSNFRAGEVDRAWGVTERAMGGDGRIDVARDIGINTQQFNRQVRELVSQNGRQNMPQISDQISQQVSRKFQADQEAFFEGESSTKDIQCKDKVVIALEAHGVPKYTNVKIRLRNGREGIIPLYIGDPVDSATGLNGAGIPRDATVIEKTHSGWYFGYKSSGMSTAALINGEVLDPILKKIKSCNVIFITDACFSGSIKYHQMIKRPGVSVFMSADAFHPAVAVQGIPLYSRGFQQSITRGGTAADAHTRGSGVGAQMRERMNDEYKKRIDNQNPQSYHTQRSCTCPCANETITTVTENITLPPPTVGVIPGNTGQRLCTEDSYSEAADCMQRCYGGSCIDSATGSRYYQGYSSKPESCYSCEFGPKCAEGTFTKAQCDALCKSTGTSSQCVYAESANERDDKTPCYKCEAIKQCPSGTTKNSCPEGCDLCQKYSTLPDGTNCMQCKTVTCSGSWKTEAECRQNCPSYYSSCKVVASQGEVQCWDCSGMVCESYCQSEGLVVSQAGAYSDYIVNYLNQNGYCKERATIHYSTVGKDSCTCARQPTIDISGEAVCRGTVCGDVACGGSASCETAQGTTTVSCSWGGWKWEGANTYRPQIGTA